MPPPTFTGTVDSFYRVPSPLRPGQPGQLIRVQPVSRDATSVTLRVMYHSRDTGGHDRAVTGEITYPTAAPPAGGWPVISWAHGTSGMATQCAPSRSSQPPSFGIKGIDVATDYIGLGPIGERHPYLSGASEAHSVIDAVRAARNLAAAHAGTRWLAIGHSQGGHAALFTNQLAASYAPQLHLLGTVALAPGAVLNRNFGPSDDVLSKVIGAMVLYGLATDYPNLHPAQYVTKVTASKAKVIDTGCLDEIGVAFATIPDGQEFTRDPRTTEPARSILAANEPGEVKSSSPLLVVQGTADLTVLPARTRALMRQLCAVGQVVRFVSVPGADHGSVLPRSAATVTAWLRDRLAGGPAPDTCPST